ncbi:peptide chain release factor N(5)-glutamine methyltransferase [Hydrogenophaga sp. SNF1]|uniref:peptide chain release factor N(5)-glutamine methyltransferase n=1 Tax=Hydrogenophaga sp. SNF1 TaxID=3098762 RepID=UPI002ACBE555|nr:peptide chain release factor N(5)-glutamine methyltransferase [Hydrogenophaga sp. SNF1]WQB84627.1 peptide chain release factor N(5)-glutamine methyltransferase [Hydrogenophaga sp. SNF1]
MTIADTLRALVTSGVPRLEAQQLLLLALGRDPQARAWLAAHDELTLDDSARTRLAALARRHRDGEPMAYLRGEQGFHGLVLRSDPRALAPRPDTETLVDWALELLAGLPPDARAIDLGTGSGAIALALLHAAPGLRLTATDASEAALSLARENAQRLGLSLRFAAGAWLAAVPGERFELILSNPPYIAAGDPHLAALRHEPLSALVSGADGLDDIRAIVAQAPGALTPGGWLLLEHGHDQAEAVQALLRAAGFEAVGGRTDLAGIVRCSGGRWPAAR